MKRILIILLIILAFTQCFKFGSKNRSSDNSGDSDLELSDSTSKPNIDFDAVYKQIMSSEKMDIDVFFAVSVYHKYYISQFMDQTANMSEEEQKDFFLKKKKEFFNSIKYTEEEYNSFMQDHADEMNHYINTHKDIGQYLISIN